MAREVARRPSSASGDPFRVNMMLNYILAVLGLSFLAGLWALVQLWHGRVNPESPGMERSCGSCEHSCEGKDGLTDGASTQVQGERRLSHESIKGKEES